MKEKRTIIQTVAGIHIPPRKKPVFDKQPLTIRLAITGLVPSKKNNYTADRNYKKLSSLLKPGTVLTPALIKEIMDVKPYVRRSKRYQKWEEETKAKLAEQAGAWLKSFENQGLRYPIKKCSISYYHFWADNTARDNSNKHEGFDDMLVSLGIIKSDAFQCLFKGNQEAGNYHGEVLDHITVINITAYDY